MAGRKKRPKYCLGNPKRPCLYEPSFTSHRKRQPASLYWILMAPWSPKVLIRGPGSIHSPLRRSRSRRPRQPLHLPLIKLSRCRKTNGRSAFCSPELGFTHDPENLFSFVCELYLPECTITVKGSAMPKLAAQRWPSARIPQVSHRSPPLCASCLGVFVLCFSAAALAARSE